MVVESAQRRCYGHRFLKHHEEVFVWVVAETMKHLVNIKAHVLMPTTLKTGSIKVAFSFATKTPSRCFRCFVFLLNSG